MRRKLSMRLKRFQICLCRHVVAAAEAADGQIFTGFLVEGTYGVFSFMCRTSGPFIMYQQSDRPRSSCIIAFETSLLMEKVLGCLSPCREILLELNAENRHLEFMVDYESRKTITLGELMPFWWGMERSSERE